MVDEFYEEEVYGEEFVDGLHISLGEWVAMEDPRHA